MKKFDTLYKRSTKGKIQEWTMVADGAQYWSISGEVGGKLTTTKPSTAEPKNVGKANESSPEEQALKEAQAKWDYKRERGYTDDIDEVDNTGYQEPMRAKVFIEHEKKVTYPVWVDDKLNGVRCWNVKNDPRSRKNKPFNTLVHIQEELQPLYDTYPDLYLDGELFNPKLLNHLGRIDLGELVELVSVNMKPKDLTPELLAKSRKIVQYHTYDGYGYEGITRATPFRQRRAALQKLLKDFEYVFPLKCKECKNRAEVDAELEKRRIAKREGIIIRWGDCPYEFSRTDTLLKYKTWITEEFTIVELQEGDADWKGCAKRAILKLPKPAVGRDGKIQTTFSAGIEGNMARARRWFETRDDVVGKLGSVTFGEYSKYGVPIQGVLETIRDYE